MATFYGTKPIVTTGLVFALDAADTNSYPGSGTTWYDISGSGKNGTLVNGIGYDSTNGGSLTFNGSNQYVDLNANFGTLSQYTISFWARRDAENRMLICSRGSTNFYWYGDNSWRYSGGEYYYPKPTSIPLGTWGNYVVTYDGSNVIIYRQGVYQGQQAASGTADFSSGFTFGSYNLSGGYYFSGLASMFQIYNRALSATEIQQNYNALKSRYLPSPQAPSLAPILPAIALITNGLALYLDAGNSNSYPGSGSTWYDLSGNNNHMTLTNSPTFSSANGGILQFNTSQSAYINSLNYSTSSFTIIAASRYTGGGTRRVISSPGTNWLFGHWGGHTEEYYANGWMTANNSPNDTNWRIYAATENYSGNSRHFYVNNVDKTSNPSGGSSGFNGLGVNKDPYGETSDCAVSFILVYNRILSTDELTYTYNLLKSRFGL